MTDDPCLISTAAFGLSFFFFLSFEDIKMFDFHPVSNSAARLLFIVSSVIFFGSVSLY